MALLDADAAPTDAPTPLLPAATTELLPPPTTTSLLFSLCNTETNKERVFQHKDCEYK